MHSLILGTAGHIDHGKTELVRALTGVDTDRLKEEKERGITIDLGFAELPSEDARWGVVDVPGHEGFIRNMLAGATGMDVVLLVVAADEGVMPQTREHLAIVRLLGVERLVVALTKVDLVEPEWLELVRDDVRALLAGTPYADATLVPTSARTGVGLDELRQVLGATGSGVSSGVADDLVQLPLDRVFTVRGTGTVATGTLWSGTLSVGERVRLMPAGIPARVRALQVHGKEVEQALAGQRTAVALSGERVDRDRVLRGQTLVTDAAWLPSRMLTVRFTLLADTSWELAHNQRVRVHLGTSEVLARCVLFGPGPLRAGGTAWGQLRLESPTMARARQRIVLRSYSPMTTIGGAEVAEPHPPKRRRAQAELAESLEAVLGGEVARALRAVVELAGAPGIEKGCLPVATGLPPADLEDGLAALASAGGLEVAAGRWVSPGVVEGARRAVLERIDEEHARAPFRPGATLDALREVLGGRVPVGLTDAVLAALVVEGAVRVDRGLAGRADFHPRFSAQQEALGRRLQDVYEEAGLRPPALAELPPGLREDPAFWELLRRLEEDGRLTLLEEGIYVSSRALTEATSAVRSALSGRSGLGPADFKEAIPVSRRHLLPILAYLDRTGVTSRSGETRAVP